jgi:hypothetical protein
LVKAGTCDVLFDHNIVLGSEHFTMAHAALSTSFYMFYKYCSALLYISHDHFGWCFEPPASLQSTASAFAFLP